MSTKEKKKRGFPSAFTVLAIILVLAAALTYIIPSGQFSRLTYDDSTNEFVITAGGQLNRTYVEPNVDYQVKDFALEEIMYDPQTSGGLLISIPEEEAQQLLENLNTLEIKSAIVGRVIEKQEKAVIVK